MPLAIDITVIALRALAFVAALQAAGSAIFLSLFGSDLAKSASAVWRLALVSAAAACVLIIAQHMLEPARMTASYAGVFDRTLQAILLASDAGTARSMRVLGLGIVLWAAVSAHSYRRELALIGAVLALASFAFMGHTAAHEARWALSTLLLLHLVAAAFWFGALATFWLSTTREDITTTASIVQHFSAIASWLVPLILVAGVAMAAILLPDLAALGTPYGALLLTKLIAFAALMALAAQNKFRLGPAIARDDTRAVHTFRRVVGAEWLIVAIVLMVTAVLTGLFGPE